MKLSSAFAVTATVLLTFGLAQTALADAPRYQTGDLDPTTRPAYVTDRIKVQVTPQAMLSPNFSIIQSGPSVTTGLTSLDQLLASSNATDMSLAIRQPLDRRMATDLGLDRWFVVSVPEGADVETMIQQFTINPHVTTATPEYIAYTTATPNDPKYSMQWGHNNTGQMLDYCFGCGGHPSGSPVGTVGFDADAEAAWDESQGYGSSSVVIAILDSGVDAGHADLNQVTGYDYGDNDTNPTDDSAAPGHGTACAGVAAAIANNNLGVAGAAGGCSIMPLKVSNSAGSLLFTSIQNALVHAADNGADVASMSFGAAITSDPSTDSSLLYAYNAGVTLLAATGNENASTISYPAINANVIAVGAASPCGDRKRSSSNSGEVNPGVATDPNGTTCDGETWWGSNYGSTTQDASSAVDLIAPTILPTTDISGSGGYDSGDYSDWFNGTSCATPYAAGVAGLVLSANPSFTPAEVRAAMISSCTDINNVEAGAGWDRYTGYGMVNSAGAVGSGTGGTQDYATLPYTTGFESGLDTYWDTESSSSFGRIQTTSANGPHGGSSHLTMDVTTNGNYATNQSLLHLDLSTESQVDLDFWWKEFGDETHTEDGVYFSDNGGASFVKVQDLAGQSYTNNTWQQFSLDLDALASSNGLSLSSEFVIRFQQYDNYAITTDGHAIDDIAVTSGGAPTPTVTLTAPNGGESFASGASASVTWSSTGSVSSVDLDYSLDGGGSWLTMASATANDGSYSWTVPASATTQGRVRVSDASNGAVTDQSDGNFTITVPSGGDYASLPYSTGFEGGFDTYWDTESSNSFGRIQTTSANGPHGGSSHLTMDVTTNGNFATNESRLSLDLSGETQVDLEFWWKEFGDETHTEDGVFFSDDGGSSFVKVLDLAGQSYTNNTWESFALDVDALAASNGLSLTATFVVKFQQYDNYAITTDGHAIDDVSVTAGTTGGSIYATLPYSTGFESGSFDDYWTSSSTADGRIRHLTTNTPHGGAYHVTMDDLSSGGFSENDVWLRLDLSGESQVDLDFWWKEFGDETHGQDGLYLSDDAGASFVKVLDLNGASYTNNTWQSFNVDIDALASANGLSLSSTFVVQWTQYDNYPMTSDGHAIDDISVTSGGGGVAYITSETEPNGDSANASGPVGTGIAVSGELSSGTDDDWYYFDVNAAGNVNVSLDINGSSDLDWFLYDASLTEVARGYTTNNPEAGSYTASTGRYYLFVDGYQGATSTYTLTVSGGLQRFPLASAPALPKEARLYQSAPNPFSSAVSEVSIRYDLPRTGKVAIEIYDPQGRRVKTLVNREVDPGHHAVTWNGENDFGERVASGVYFYVLKSESSRFRRKMLMLK